MLPVILAVLFMALFDTFVVNVAAPSLQRDLHAGDAALELIVGGYAFTYASGMVTGGKLGDLFGYRRLFLVGVASFTLASLLCGLAQTPAQLVGARLLQGLAGALMSPQVLALITATFPAAERPRALSWLGVTVGIGSVAGQVLGGVLLDANLFGWGWRTIFLVNVPVGVAVIVAGARMLPAARRPGSHRLDPVGAIGVSATLALALVPLVLGRSQGWPTWTWVALAACLPVGAAVIGWERVLDRRGGQPLLDLGLLRNRPYVAGLVIIVAFMAAFGGTMFGLTLMLQVGLNLSPLAAGLTFGPLGIAFAITSIAARRLVERYGIRVITVGSLIGALGLLWLFAELRLADHVTVASVLSPMILVGLGNGLVMPSLIGIALSRVTPQRAGIASGMFTTAQQFASAAGVAVLGVVFFAGLDPHAGHGGFVNALAPVILIAGALVLVGAALTPLLPRPGAAPARRLAESAATAAPATEPAGPAVAADSGEYVSPAA